MNVTVAVFRRHTMPESSQLRPAVFDPIEVAAASAAFCSQFGEVSAEAYRRAALHEVLDRANVLAQALATYVRGARMHFRGVHCTADMRGDATALSCALHAWSDSVKMAADVYQTWQERLVLSDHQGHDRVAAALLFQDEVSGAPVSIEISEMDERS